MASLVLLALNEQPCEAQSFALPVDVHQGLVAGTDGRRTPYLFELRTGPAIDFGPLRAAATLGPVYWNPRWDLALGAELSIFAAASAQRVGLRLALEGAYLPWQHTGRVGMGVVVEAFGLLRIGVWPGLALDSRRLALTTSLGLDVMSWLELLRRSD